MKRREPDGEAEADRPRLLAAGAAFRAERVDTRCRRDGALTRRWLGMRGAAMVAVFARRPPLPGVRLGARGRFGYHGHGPAGSVGLSMARVRVRLTRRGIVDPAFRGVDVDFEKRSPR